MNLKENYERLFGSLPKVDRLGHTVSEKNTITEHQATEWAVFVKKFRNQFPKSDLKIKSGNVLMNNLIVESVSKFFNRTETDKIQILKAKANKVL